MICVSLADQNVQMRAHILDILMRFLNVTFNCAFCPFQSVEGMDRAKYRLASYKETSASELFLK